tara:strand:+ start:276 stop:635 length:360 start_codon:yes stop_codon:yes gene_type:complete
MATKEELKEKITGWIKLEQEIKLLQKELKNRREKRKEYTHDLVDIMKENEIDCFDLAEGKIIYTKNKVKAPLSKKTLTEGLNTFFEESPNINVEEVCQFIMENRQITIKENIRHKQDKK